MPAVAEREESKHEFIGHVFAKSSPILTWRPTKVQRITPTPAGSSGVVERMSDSGLHSFSRAPTKRMVAWPVVQRVHGSKQHALRALLTLVAFSLLCGSALTLCVYVLLGETSTASHPKPPSTRVAVTHAIHARFDTLLPPAAPLPAPAEAPVEPRRTAARSHGGHVQHGHRYPASSLHAGRAPRGTRGTNHRAT